MDPSVGKIPWRTERLPTPVFWTGEFHGIYSPWGGKGSDMTERLSLHFKLWYINEDNGNLLQKVPCMHCYTQCPQPCSRPPPTDASAGNSWALRSKSGSVSCGVTALFSCVLVCTRFCLCSPSVCFPVLCKFWRLCGGVDSDLPQVDLCHTQVCCTQSPGPCGSPLLTRTSRGDSVESTLL